MTATKAAKARSRAAATTAATLGAILGAILGAACAPATGPSELLKRPDGPQPTTVDAPPADEAPLSNDLLHRYSEAEATAWLPPPPAALAIPEWSDEQALTWLQGKCKSCHGVDEATHTRALYYSAWPLPEGGVTKEFLETSEYSSIAYQTLLNRALPAAAASPSPMPPGDLDEAQRLEIRAVLAWFSRAVPYAVIDADARYGNDATTHEKVVLRFQCEHPSTLRTFFSRASFAALDRPPTPAEIAAFSAAELAEPVTLAQREAIVGRLATAWRDEFLATGLRKLADVIGGAPGIRTGGQITAAIAADLREELYQTFRLRYDSAPYESYFTSNVVMASPNTAPLYGCSPGNGWAPCTLAPPRAGFFTTVGFLASKPQSFLLESTNHGRVASLYFTLYGEALLAATDGPSGSDTPALPTCLESTDTRAYQAAPRGSAAVPAYGKVCQSCHVSRHMAAGSVLFRPYATDGRVYGAGTLGGAGGPDAALVDAAVTEAWTYLSSAGETRRVDKTFLVGLLSSPPKACVATGQTATPYIGVGSVADLAAHLIANRPALARGFMRHAQRAFSNVTPITLELGLAAMKVMETERRTLADLVRAYFLSESFACEGEP
jgi:hypothetical protein